MLVEVIHKAPFQLNGSQLECSRIQVIGSVVEELTGQHQRSHPKGLHWLVTDNQPTYRRMAKN